MVGNVYVSVCPIVIVILIVEYMLLAEISVLKISHFYRVFRKYCVTSRIIFSILPPLPDLPLAAIGYTENVQLIGGVT